MLHVRRLCFTSSLVLLHLSALHLQVSLPELLTEVIADTTFQLWDPVFVRCEDYVDGSRNFPRISP